MIWTIMPENMVINESSDFPELQEITWGGKRILCYPVSPGKMCVFRIISSDPSDYLKSYLQPGSILDISRNNFK